MASDLERRDQVARTGPAPGDDVFASEVAAYVYCAKAWHLEHVLGHGAGAPTAERRQAGVAQHEAHGARVRRLQRVGQPLLRAAVFFLALAGVLTAAALLIGQG